MVLFCMGLALGQFQRYSRPVEDAQRSAALMLLGALHHGDTSSGQAQQQAALQHFLLALFTQDKHNESRYSLTVFRFLVLYSFRREGCLAKSGTVTQYVSKVVFIGRGAILNEIKKAMAMNNQGYFSWVTQTYCTSPAVSLFSHASGLSPPFVHISPSNLIMSYPTSTSPATCSRSSTMSRSRM